MSIDRINRPMYINAYNSNYNKPAEKVNKIKEDVDRIEISQLGKSLMDYSLDKNIDNTKKIEEIKSEIDNGTYTVDAKLTAQSILDAIKGSKS